MNMLERLNELALKAPSPSLFLAGLGVLYVTGAILLIAVGIKFYQHARNPQPLSKECRHFFSTYGMTLCVLALFPPIVNSKGILMPTLPLNYIQFGIGLFLLVFGFFWHLWAKVNIRLMWSDGIEIKKEHPLIIHGAYAWARHPMYASLLMWCWGASLMMFNGLAFLLVSCVILPLMIVRAKAEEKELTKIHIDYILYQQNVRMLTPSVGGAGAFVIKVLGIALLGYCVWLQITWANLPLLVFVHLYLGYSLKPEKVAFSYRSKAGMMVVFFLLTMLWQPFYYMLYVILAMFVYGLFFNCPCMIVYNRYGRCPCFGLIEKCVLQYSSKK